MVKQLRWVLLAVFVSVLSVGGTARADDEVLSIFTTRMPDLTTEKGQEDVPWIDVTVINAPNAPMEKFVLVDKSSRTPIELKATSKRDFKSGNETLAVVIVMSGWEMWIGNDKEVPDMRDDSPDKYPGVLIDLRNALDKLNFKDAGPPGSKGMIITYADKPVVRLPMGPLSEVSGSKLGTQNDYYKTTGVELVSAIRMALAELKKVQAARKVMIVIGDGNDTNNEAAKGQLKELKKEAQQEKIQTFAIVYRTKLSNEGNVIPIFTTSSPAVVATAENIAAGVQSILAKMADRQYLTFPGWIKTGEGKGFNWDGKTHDLVIKIDKDEITEPVGVPLPFWDPHPDKGGFPMWGIILIIVGGLLLLVILAVVIFGGKKQEAPMPMPMPMAAAPAPMPMEAPKPAGPMKTVMIGQGGDEGGFPVVGWLVPLNGPAAYQTLRLRSSGTKIGTAPPADIVVNDGFMSTDHCLINCSPQGYILVDGGSTNGSYVNDRKIQGKHELVDNDMITLGKTNFKFKSIV